MKKISNNPKKYLKRSDVGKDGNTASHKEKIKRKKLDPKDEFYPETIDSNWYYKKNRGKVKMNKKLKLALKNYSDYLKVNVKKEELIEIIVDHAEKFYPKEVVTAHYKEKLKPGPG